MGATFRIIKNKMIPRTGVQTTKTKARRGFIQKDSATPMTSMTGPRTNGRKPPFIAFCKTVTSVVIRVTRDELSK